MNDAVQNQTQRVYNDVALAALHLLAWSSGTYSYDGAGNIKSIGTSTFAYDKVNRLVTANLFDGPTGGGNFKQQSYTFDAYGNITGITTNGVLRNTPTSATTNRLTGAVSYDAAGNLTGWNGALYQYDRFNQMTRMVSGSEDWTYIYTADDERIWSYSPNLSRWTLRDLDGKVLREYLTDSRGWSVGTDYFYRDGLLMAAETQTGRRHFHLDHLGTPRLITRASGDRAAYHVYYPFGEEATAFNQDNERLKFTGHERDLGSAGGAGDDLDYMHARHESPVTGRFLSMDPAKSWKADEPQTWNAYTYVTQNPLRYIDPDGEERAEILLNTDVKELLQGQITRDQYNERLQARGVGAAIGGASGFGILAATGEAGLAASLNAAFRLYGTARGNLIHTILGNAYGGALPRTFPVIDRFLNGVATSTKTLDLTAQRYQSIGRLTGHLQRLVSGLANFQGDRLGSVVVRGEEITARVLELVVQRSALTTEQALAIAEVAKKAQQLGVFIRVIGVP